MKIIDIKIDDIQEKALWQVINFDSSNWFDWYQNRIVIHIDLPI